MSFYNMLHGTNPLAGPLLGLLGFTPDQFGRLRDVYLVEHEGDLRIAVFTRCGGGNRESYQSVFDWAETQPGYIRDYDDDYDCTYATIEFAIPDSEEGRYVQEQIAELSDEQRSVAINSKSLKDRFEEATDRLCENIKEGQS